MVVGLVLGGGNRWGCGGRAALKNKYKDDLKHVESLRLMYGHAQRQADRSEKRLKKAQYMIANELFMCLPVDWSEEHLDFETEEDGDNGLE